MRVAVLSLTRDRLAYTQANFPLLEQNAGCEYDHYVLDQGSTDGTQDWLADHLPPDWLHFSSSNLGICPALNLLLDEIVNPADYDVIVRFDNDAEVTMPGTLNGVCEVVHDNEDTILAPKVLGLRNPPTSPGTFTLGHNDEHVVDETAILGGVFMAIPAWVFDKGNFRFDENSPPWGGDEYVTSWLRERGGRCGYLRPWEVWHRSDQHDADHPVYWGRKKREMGIA